MRLIAFAAMSMIVMLSTVAAFGLEAKKLVLKPNHDYSSQTPLSVGLAEYIQSGQSNYYGTIFPMTEGVEDQARSIHASLTKGRSQVALCDGKLVTAQAGNLVFTFVKVYSLENCQIVSEEKFMKGDL